MKNKRQYALKLHEPELGSNIIEMQVGTSEKKFKNFKSRINFYWESKENVDDFIKTLRKYSKIAFKDSSL